MCGFLTGDPAGTRTRVLAVKIDARFELTFGFLLLNLEVVQVLLKLLNQGRWLNHLPTGPKIPDASVGRSTRYLFIWLIKWRRIAC